MPWQILIEAGVGIFVAYGALLLSLWRQSRRHPEVLRFRSALRLLPDIVRLVRRLAADPQLGTSVRIRLILLLAYLASPIDLVPDFIPVLGYADDALAVALVLRSVARRAGPEALRRHWPGTLDGLAVLERFSGIELPPDSASRPSPGNTCT